MFWDFWIKVIRLWKVLSIKNWRYTILKKVLMARYKRWLFRRYNKISGSIDLEDFSTRVLSARSCFDNFGNYGKGICDECGCEVIDKILEGEFDCKCFKSLNS